MQANVLVEINAKKLDKTFTYHVPKHLEQEVMIGKRVQVPFQKKYLEGFVLSVHEDQKLEYEIKDIESVIDEYPVINAEMLKLGEFISKTTFSTLISTYQAMLPKALKAKNGCIINKKYDVYLELIDKDYIPKNDTTKEIIELLKSGRVLKSKAQEISVSSVNTLKKHNVIKEIKEEVYRLNTKEEKEVSKIVLNEEQQNVLDTVKKSLNTYKPYLLFGVTGSGKTEVYMHIIDEVLKDDKEVIVLVPEISLTPQMVNIFKKRFGSTVAILHSRLSDGEKYDEWRKIEKKEVKIVIGARSAIFAPFTNLGMIIIDEEHTTTYKQENNPRYSAIDVALYRAKTHNCPVILGSATPSLESFTRVKTNEYELLTLKNRVNNNMPKVELVSMRDEMRKNNPIISEKLNEYILDRLNKKEQIILLLNRRGYSTIITCKECGHVFKCPNCEIPLTYHKGINKMKCHYCNYEKSIDLTCPKCKKNTLNSYGMGTEKLQDIISKLYKDAKVVRMDVDTTSTKGSHEKIINDFMNHKYDILIGTQMIAKGLDFPLVTLVGVINADASLNIPDFRSSERTYELLSQVSGRAGRKDLLGNVVIQGFNIDHYSIELSKKHNYELFYNEEIKIRKALNYPPFCNLAFIYLKGKDINVLNKEGQNIVNFLKKKIDNVTILGPSMANMFKVNNIYNVQIIIKYKSLKTIYEYLDYLNKHYLLNSKLTFEIDINPLRM